MERDTGRATPILIFGVLGAALLAWTLWPRPELVEIAPVEIGSLVVTLDEEGETRVRERFTVSAPVDGRLLRIALEPGDPVRANETVLAVFRPREASLLDPRSRAEAEEEVRAREAELAQARYERAGVEAELAYARRECDRAEALGAQGVLAMQRIDAARLAEQSAVERLNAAEQAAASARHRLSSARARLISLGDAERRGDDPVRIRAPIDGVVLRRFHESEAIVRAGEPLMEIGDPDDLEIIADYLSRDAVRIRPGATARVERWGGDGALEARVIRVEPSGFTKTSALGVEEKRVNVVLEIVTPPAERVGLADGFRVETRIVTYACEGIPQVPAGSLFRDGEDWAVYVIEDGRAVRRAVEIGGRSPERVEIRGGLSPDARVIVHPSDRIRDGVRVEARLPVATD